MGKTGAMPARVATVRDASIVAEMLTAFNLEFGTWAPPVDVLADRLRRLLSRSDVWVLLSVAPDPVGFALVTTRRSPYYDGPIAALDELYVAPERRGQGLGSELMALLITEARSHDVGEIQINVDESDQDTRRFYESHGFSNHDDGERMLCYLREL